MGTKERRYDVIEISGTTSAGGAAVVDSDQKHIIGEVLAVWVDGTNLTDGADLDMNGVYTDVDDNEILGEDFINHEDVGNATLNELYPRNFAQDIAGADLVAPATYKFAVPFVLWDCPIRVTIANGGNAVAFAVRVLVAL